MHSAAYTHTHTHMDRRPQNVTLPRIGKKTKKKKTGRCGSLCPAASCGWSFSFPCMPMSQAWGRSRRSQTGGVRWSRPRADDATIAAAATWQAEEIFRTKFFFYVCSASQFSSNGTGFGFPLQSAAEEYYTAENSRETSRILMIAYNIIKLCRLFSSFVSVSVKSPWVFFLIPPQSIDPDFISTFSHPSKRSKDTSASLTVIALFITQRLASVFSAVIILVVLSVIDSHTPPSHVRGG